MDSIALSERLRLGAIIAGYQARALLAAIYASPLYRWRFSGHAPDRLTVAPQDLRTADPTIAAEIYSGRYSLAGQIGESGGSSPFQIDPPSAEWQRELHGFGWLRHLRAADSELARLHARALVEDWLTDFGGWHPVAWDAEVVGQRLISWFSHSPLLLRGAERPFYRRFMRSLARQTRYLHRTASDTGDGAPRLVAAIALAYAGLCMAGRPRLLRQASRWLDDELDRQILPDGAHISRNPRIIVELLLDLLPLRQTFLACDVAPSRALMSAIDRMMPMLRFFRHPDGALAHFNGMGPTHADLLATLLAYDDARGSPLSNAPYAGYQRLEARNSLVIMDTGVPPPYLVSSQAHASCLSFEFTGAGSRMIVNCGVPEFGDRQWRMVARSTAAHSTATIEDTSSARFASATWVCRRLGAVVMSGPREVRVARAGDPALEVTASHDGYLPGFGLIHKRRLSLSEEGDRLDGEDMFQLGRSGSDDDPAYAIRFHLHPSARASLTRDGERVVIVSGSGEAWEFTAEGSAPTIEESAYLGATEGPRRSEQIVLHGRSRLSPVVVWRLQRLDQQPARRSGRRTGEIAELPLEDSSDTEG
jgi:uncharacterized heparinase superfamily protein